MSRALGPCFSVYSYGILQRPPALIFAIRVTEELAMHRRRSIPARRDPNSFAARFESLEPRRLLCASDELAGLAIVGTHNHSAPHFDILRPIERSFDLAT